MSTTSSYQVRVIQTYASNVTGGVTSGTTYSHISSQRRTAPSPSGGGITPPGNPNCPNCVWDEEGNCIYCGHNKYEDGCTCGGDGSDCHCPIAFDWQVVLFLSALACAYMVYKETKNKQSV